MTVLTVVLLPGVSLLRGRGGGGWGRGGWCVSIEAWRPTERLERPPGVRQSQLGRARPELRSEDRLPARYQAILQTRTDLRPSNTFRHSIVSPSIHCRYVLQYVIIVIIHQYWIIKLLSYSCIARLMLLLRFLGGNIMNELLFMSTICKMFKIFNFVSNIKVEITLHKQTIC